MRACRCLAALGVFALTTACTPDPRHRRVAAVSAGVVDSALPMGEQLRRFRATIADTVVRLRGGSASRESLVSRSVQAMALADTAFVLGLTLTPSEFAWLYYAGSRLARPPYELPPALAWFQIRGNTEADLRRAIAFAHDGGARYVSHDCDSLVVEGANRIHSSCRVRLRRGSAAEETAVLFGSIVERDGQFKFLGLANHM